MQSHAQFYFTFLSSMMKKFLIASLFLIPIMMGINSTHADNLQNIFLDYCNTDAKTLSYTIDTNVETGICYTVSNNSSQETTVKVNFIDGTFTNDKEAAQACWDEGRKEMFGQYVTGYQSLVTL